MPFEPAPPAPQTPAPALQVSEADQKQAGRKKRKKDKVRAAWISFVGRIVAQFVGSAATIGLGLFLVHKYQAPGAQTASRAVSTVSPGVTRAASSVPGQTSLAVLPLRNFSADPRQEYFADGMTEALITDLARIHGLRVISRTSSMYYKNQVKPLPAIARELNVDVVVEGSVVQAAGRVRIAAQLIDARSDEHLWAQSYERPFGDILALQAEVATAIAREVHALAARPHVERDAPGNSRGRSGRVQTDPLVAEQR